MSYALDAIVAAAHAYQSLQSLPLQSLQGLALVHSSSVSQYLYASVYTTHQVYWTNPCPIDCTIMITNSYNIKKTNYFIKKLVQ